MKKLTKWPYILDSERTPLVDQLLEILKERDDYIKDLEVEIKRIKRLPAKPKLDRNKKKSQKPNSVDDKRAGSFKAHKTKELVIHKRHVMVVSEKPEGCVFKGYRYFTVQDIEINAVNHLFKCERWQRPNGGYLQAPLPKEYIGHHFGPTLRAYVLHQYYHQGVTQGLLWMQLNEWGIKISKGQLNALLIENKTSYHEEKEALYESGLRASYYLQVDDTGARHQGKNGYCTYIGNKYFAYFQSSYRKNRVNFLKCLQGEKRMYLLDNIALSYISQKKLALDKCRAVAELIKDSPFFAFSEEDVEEELNRLDILKDKEVKICIEATLYSYLIQYKLLKPLMLMSDEAGQFNLPGIIHGLCWLHVERKLKQLMAVTDEQIKHLEAKRQSFWELYEGLKEYRDKPNQAGLKEELKEAFEQLCRPVENYLGLNTVLSRIKRWEQKLLIVLEHPNLPLDNNMSERDIRDIVRRRKMSGTTRSDDGRKARDTFISLKKTCQKVGVNFWDYLLDRTHRTGKIKSLGDYISVMKFNDCPQHGSQPTSTY